jgi:hypothetical protein
VRKKPQISNVICTDNTGATDESFVIQEGDLTLHFQDTLFKFHVQKVLKGPRRRNSKRRGKECNHQENYFLIIGYQSIRKYGYSWGYKPGPRIYYLKQLIANTLKIKYFAKR